MRVAWWTSIAFAALLGAAWGRAPYADDTAPSPVIYPEQRLPLVFTHAAHLGRGMVCVDCHAAAVTSRSAVDNLLPGEDACRGCHAIDRAQPDKQATPPARCDACHVGYVAGQVPARVYLPPPNLKFDHARHVGRGVACTACHGDLAAEGVALATRDQLPRMRLCLDCHDGKRAPSACSTCHLAEVGVLRTDLDDGALIPSGVVYGDAHDLGFAHHHAAAASRDPAYCAACHRQSFCSDCHAGLVKPMDFHPGDYALTHAADARRNSPDCSACHRKQSFCVGCHERSGVGSRASGFDAADPRARFHPDDWASLAGANRHAREARANLDACASCHREDDCLACHTAELGSPRVNPHGPGWRGSRRCRALAARNPRMCSRCHIDPAERGCDW
jgi:hypothetical protein